jgi:homoserine dehydrogenase
MQTWLQKLHKNPSQPRYLNRLIGTAACNHTLTFACLFCTAVVPQYDADMAAKAAEAANAGCVMRYVGEVDMAAGTASVSVQSYPSSHPFAQLSGSENMIVFTTERYSAQTPLVIRGPGAGAEVTAAGVFGDLLAVLRYSAGART